MSQKPKFQMPKLLFVSIRLYQTAPALKQAVYAPHFGACAARIRLYIENVF